MARKRTKATDVAGVVISPSNHSREEQGYVAYGQRENASKSFRLCSLVFRRGHLLQPACSSSPRGCAALRYLRAQQAVEAFRVGVSGRGGRSALSGTHVQKGNKYPTPVLEIKGSKKLSVFALTRLKGPR